MRKFLMGAAAIALAAGGAYADPGNGRDNGKGNGGDKGAPAAAMQSNGNGNAKAAKGPSMKEAKADNGPSIKEAKADHGPSMKAAKVDAKVDKGPPAKAAKVDRAPQVKHSKKADHSVDRRVVQGNRSNDGRDYRREGYRDLRTLTFNGRDNYGYVEGCPPGLAKKHNGCTPPGLAKGDNHYYQPSYFGYRSVTDGRYYYDDGYLYRTGSNGSILGYIPLLGGALSVGNQWPSYYQPAEVPQYYVDYYNLGPSNSYRYADNVLYRVDPQTLDDQLDRGVADRRPVLGRPADAVGV